MFALSGENEIHYAILSQIKNILPLAEFNTARLQLSSIQFSNYVFRLYKYQKQSPEVIYKKGVLVQSYENANIPTKMQISNHLAKLSKSTDLYLT